MDGFRDDHGNPIAYNKDHPEIPDSCSEYITLGYGCGFVLDDYANIVEQNIKDATEKVLGNLYACMRQINESGKEIEKFYIGFEGKMKPQTLMSAIQTLGKLMA